MASADLDAIRVAISDILSNLEVRSYAFVPDTLQPPAAYIKVQNINYDMDFDGDLDATLVIKLIAPSIITEGGQSMLNGLISPVGDSSVSAALYADPTLGGTVKSFQITRMQNYDPVVLAESGVRYWSAELVLDIYA